VTYQIASEFYGAGSLEQNAVKTGWAEVGINVEGGGGGNGGGKTGCLSVLFTTFIDRLSR
jgi:hypothetical protein